MIKTPYYLIDEAKLLQNMQKIAYLREASGAKALMALKCFATWSAFDSMRDYMDGTTSSSLFELRLGREKFGKETHAYSVAWSDGEIDEAISYADKIIFNSLGQLTRYAEKSAHIERGLRLNPRFSTSGFDLADPARPFSRLGEWDMARLEEALPMISGVMIHYNCENRDFDLFDQQLTRIETEFGGFLKQLKWVSLAGESISLARVTRLIGSQPASRPSRKAWACKSIWNRARPRSPRRRRWKSLSSISSTTARKSPSSIARQRRICWIS